MSAIVKDGQVITLTGINANWSWFDDLPAFATSKVGVPIHSIQFKPGAALDRCIIRNLDGSGPSIFDAECKNAYDNKVEYYYGEEMKPFLEVLGGVYNAAARVIIILSTKGK